MGDVKDNVDSNAEFPSFQNKRNDSLTFSSNSLKKRISAPWTSSSGDNPDADLRKEYKGQHQINDRSVNDNLNKSELKTVFDPRAEYERLMNTRAGGVYVPPARLKALQAHITDKESKEYQRMYWEALKKSINGLINKAQAVSLPFTPIYSALTAVINTKLPSIGELLLTRLIVQFRKAYKRNDKFFCLSSTMFIAHLINHQVAQELVALEILALLLERPSNDAIEVAVGFMREVGAYLADVSPRGSNAVFERFRAILHEGAIEKRVQYMIEVLFQVRRDKYKDNPIIPDGLDLVEDGDQITHMLSLNDELDVQEGLGIFKYDPNWQENEDQYKRIKEEILGEDSDEPSDNESISDSEDEQQCDDKIYIKDETNQTLINLRRTIYLTIIQERTYSRFYGLIGERFCKLNRFWTENFEQTFLNYYDIIHRYETNRLRNIATFFGHLLSSDAISWHVMRCIHLNEDETTSSSRIFVKILFQELMGVLGIHELDVRLKDPFLQESLSDMFPRNNPKNTRFAINYFTSIGLGMITVSLREHLETIKVCSNLESLSRSASLSATTTSSITYSSEIYSDDTSETLRSRSRARRFRKRTSQERGRARSRSRSQLSERYQLRSPSRINHRLRSSRNRSRSRLRDYSRSRNSKMRNSRMYSRSRFPSQLHNYPRNLSP
ncbi:hypothetical protein PCANB_001213 [Pneumocystis canis]|nr:hypothetical protein PCANB_001213 [Pneumocystis canis]